MRIAIAPSACSTRHRIIALLCATIVAAGCTSSRPALTGAASSTLVPQAAAVRAAASIPDVALARNRLARLRITVGDLRGQGQISATRAAAILASADEVDAELGVLSTTVAPPTTPPAPPAPPGNGGHQKGKAKGKGDSKPPAND
jgi:hypothetical protein